MRHPVNLAATVALAITVASCNGNALTSPSALPSGASRSAAQVSAAADEGGQFGANDHGRIRNTLGGSDAEFVSFAAAANQAEIEFGSLAQRVGDRTSVEAFGAQLVQDHTAALASLRDLAPHNVSQTVTLNASQQQTFNELSQLTGSAFDRAFVAAMIQSHEIAIARFQQQAQSGEPLLRDYAQGYLSALQAHLRMVRDLDTIVS
jgi:putative membrane protein